MRQGSPSLIPNLTEEEWKLCAPSAPRSELPVPASSVGPEGGQTDQCASPPSPASVQGGPAEGSGPRELT